MFSVKLDNILYIGSKLMIKRDGKFIIIYNDGIEIKRVGFTSESIANTKLNNIIVVLKETTSFYLDLDDLLGI
mgnify:FL=1